MNSKRKATPALDIPPSLSSFFGSSGTVIFSFSLSSSRSSIVPKPSGSQFSLVSFGLSSVTTSSSFSSSGSGQPSVGSVGSVSSVGSVDVSVFPSSVPGSPVSFSSSVVSVPFPSSPVVGLSSSSMGLSGQSRGTVFSGLNGSTQPGGQSGVLGYVFPEPLTELYQILKTKSPEEIASASNNRKKFTPFVAEKS